MKIDYTKPDKVVKSWVHKGRKCVIKFVNDHYCIYVQTLHKDMETENIKCHNGITWYGRLFEDDDVLYLGTAYDHYLDHIETPNYPCIICSNPHHEEDCHKWTVEELIEEAHDLVDETLKMEAIWPEIDAERRRHTKIIQQIYKRGGYDG